MLGPRDSPESLPRKSPATLVQPLELLATPVSRAHGISTRLTAAYEDKFEQGVLSRPRAQIHGHGSSNGLAMLEGEVETRVSSISLGDSGRDPTEGDTRSYEKEDGVGSDDDTPKEVHTMPSILVTPPGRSAQPPVQRGKQPAAFQFDLSPAGAALSPSQSVASPSSGRLASPTSALSPRSSKAALAVRFLLHDAQSPSAKRNSVTSKDRDGDVFQNPLPDGTKQTNRVDTLHADEEGASLPGVAVRREDEVDEFGREISSPRWSAPLSPNSAKIFSSFTIYMRGYLKQKRLQRDNKEVVRGTGGERRYFVWHSKGLSMYASESEYLNDRKPLRQLLNAWNNKFGADPLDEGLELPELTIIPYDGGNMLSNDDSSDALMRNSHRDELLLRLILATPSAIAAGVSSLPADAILMVLKAPTLREANEWLGASHRIHYAHLRDRSLHTNILPTLQSLLEDPNGFLMAHAPPSSQHQNRTLAGTARTIDFDAVAASSSADAASTACQGPVENLPLLSSLPAIPPSPAEHSFSQKLQFSTAVEEKVNAAVSSFTNTSAPSPTPSPRASSLVAPSARAKTPTSTSKEEAQLRTEKIVDTEDITIITPPSAHLDAKTLEADESQSNRFHDSNSVVTTSQQHSPAHKSSASTSRSHPKAAPRSEYGGAFGFSTYQDLTAYQERGVLPFNHTRRGSGSAAQGDAVNGNSTWYHGHQAFSPRVARTMSVITTSGAADDPVQTASSTCEYYGLNGETPLYPLLPMEDVMTRFSTPTSAAPAASSNLNLISLDKLGPRRCTVHDLLQWILFQYPGSTYQLTELLPMEPSSPSTAVASSSALWSASHLCYAFLLFRGAYLESSQLVEWLSLAWLGSAALPAHHGHHVKANVLWMVKVWVECFRRDYLQAKEHVDAFFKQSVFPEAARFEHEKEKYQSTETVPACNEWTKSGDTAKKEGPPRCCNLAKLAVHISHIIALTSGQTTPAIAQFMTIPPEYLDASAIADSTATSPSSPNSPSPPDVDPSASSLNPKPSLSRTATAPFQRRASFAVRGNMAQATSPDRAAKPVTKVVLGSQAHRPPQCFAHRASTLLFVKKFVGLGGVEGGGAQSLRNWTAQQIAQEVTNMDVEALQCIYTRELTHKAWTARSPSLLSAHAGSACAFITSFNRRSFWTATEILRAAGENVAGMASTPDGGLAARLEMLVHLINILEELLSLKNFYGAFAVLNGLGLQPLYRVKNLWAALPSRSVAQFESIKRQLDSKSNHAAYRAMVKQAAAKRIAHVPHFAVLLKDLFQLEELPTFVEDAPSISGPSGSSHADPSNDSASSAPPSQQLNWSKFAKEYVELHNSFLVAQNTVQLYERVQLIQEASALDGTEISEVFTPPNGASSGTFLTPSKGTNTGTTVGNGSAVVSPISPASERSPDLPRPQKPTPTLRSATLSSIPTVSVLRPALPPSDPALRMCLHLSLARVWNEEKLYAFSYKLRPK